MVARDAQEALAGREMVLSLVTADSALPAAQEYAAFLPKGAIWADCNSVAPGTSVPPPPRLRRRAVAMSMWRFWPRLIRRG
jgi:3-hydroxyisobutyrate dehydrogenase-like beta-hydroxyacid dehydrogenase